MRAHGSKRPRLGRIAWPSLVVDQIADEDSFVRSLRDGFLCGAELHVGDAELVRRLAEGGATPEEIAGAVLRRWRALGLRRPYAVDIVIDIIDSVLADRAAA